MDLAKVTLFHCTEYELLSVFDINKVDVWSDLPLELVRIAGLAITDADSDAMRFV